MTPLSGLDALYLHLETPETPMHVGSAHLYALPDGFNGDFHAVVQDHLARRLHLSPVFTRKLATMPFDLANPVWIDDDEVDLDYHVRRITLPRPGTPAQLAAYIARLHSSLMDRSRPLWEFYVIDGLQQPGQVAFYSKIHHAAIDGEAGNAVSAALLDTTPVPREVKPGTRRRSGPYQLGMAELLSAAAANHAQQVQKLLHALPQLQQSALDGWQRARADSPDMFKQQQALLAPGGPTAEALGLAPRTPFNASVTNQRAFAMASLPIARVKAVARVFGVTVNDLVLALCGTALRRYLMESAALPTEPLVAGVPVSLRSAGDASLNNQSTMGRVMLATHLADPVQRLQAVSAASAQMKAGMSDLRAQPQLDLPQPGAPWLVSGMTALFSRARLADHLPPQFNVTISNVRGPQQPYWLAGARMLSYHPVSIVNHGNALNITVLSYLDTLGFGLTTCRRALPDVDVLARFVIEAMDELEAVRPIPGAGDAPPAVAAVPEPVPTSHGVRTETSWRSSLSATPKPKSPARKVQPRSAWGARAIEAAK